MSRADNFLGIALGATSGGTSVAPTGSYGRRYEELTRRHFGRKMQPELFSDTTDRRL